MTLELAKGCREGWIRQQDRAAARQVLLSLLARKAHHWMAGSIARKSRACG